MQKSKTPKPDNPSPVRMNDGRTWYERNGWFGPCLTAFIIIMMLALVVAIGTGM